MIDTQRTLAPKHSSSDCIYRELFFDRVFLGCFVNRVYVVIKQRTLYLYPNQKEYQDRPDCPQMFFNLNHMNCSLSEDSVQISNGFTEVVLKHETPCKLLDLLNAINKGRTTISS